MSIPESAKNIGCYAFYGCNSLANVSLPGNTEIIEGSAFRKCTKLEAVDIPKTVKVIESQAFENCTSLVSVETHYNDTREWSGSIGTYAFKGCTSLANVNIAGSFKSWGACLFDGCSSLKSLIIPEGVTILGYYMIKGTGISSITIPSTVISNSSYGYDGVLSGCITLDEVVFAQGIKKVPDYICATSSASYLTKAYIPPTVTEIGQKAFYQCNNLTIYCKEGSYAHQYAVDNNIPFVLGEFSYNNGFNVSLPGNEYTIVVGQRGVLYADIDIPTAQNSISYTWSTSDNYVAAFDANGKNTIEGVSLIPVLSDDQRMSKISVAQPFYAISPGIVQLTCTLADGTTAGSRQVIVVASGNGQTTIESNHYNVPQYREPVNTAARSLIEEYWNAWYEAYKSYITAVENILADAKEDETASIQEQAEAMMIADKKNKSRYLTFPSDIPAHLEIYAYQALCEMLNDSAVKAGINFDKVSFKNEYTVSDGIVKAIAGSMSNYKKTFTYGNVKVAINCYMFGNCFGTITCIEKGKHYKDIVLCSNQNDCKKVAAEYLNQLKKLEHKAVNNIYTAIATDILGQPLSKLTQKYLKGKMAKFETKLNELHLGGTYRTLLSCYDYYTKYTNLRKKLKFDSPASLEGAVTALTDFTLNQDDYSDKAAKKAVGAMQKAHTKLATALQEYVTTGTVTPEKKGNWFSSLFSFNCPVNIAIYNSNKEQIGYVGADDIWYNDNIYIEEKGDAKLIYAKSLEGLSFDVIGTDYGTMDCVVEEYSDGIPVGRLNFYDVLLEIDKKVTGTLSTEQLSDKKAFLTSETDDIFADEYIPVDTNARVCITVQPTEQEECFVSGSGEYVRGDAVVLRAVPGDGYVFMGWHDKADALISVSEVYEFTAKNDLNLTAIFAKQTDSLTNHMVYMTKEYAEQYTAEIEQIERNVELRLIKLTENVDDALDAYLIQYTDDGKYQSATALKKEITASGIIYKGEIPATQYKLLILDENRRPVIEACVSE